MTPQLDLDPFAGRKQKQPELVEIATVSIDSAVKKAYEKFQDMYSISSGVETNYKIYDISMKAAKKSILEPTQIDALLQLIKRNSFQGKFDRIMLGNYLSKLIQTSYDAGHNNFELHIDGISVGFLGWELRGTETRPILLSVDGNAGDDCGWNSSYSHLSIRGDVGSSCGGQAEYSRFSIDGNAGSSCGGGAKYSRFSIDGNAGSSCGGGAEHSDFYILGDAGIWCGANAKYSQFTVHGDVDTGALCGVRNEDSHLFVYSSRAFEVAKTYFKNVDKSNTIVLLGNDGREIERLTK